MSAIDITHLAPIEAPHELRDLPAWVIWRFEPNDNPGGKPRKVPYYTAGGRRWGEHGTPEDRRQLTDFQSARAAAARRGFDGVGFATLSDFGIVALDFDNCVQDGEVFPEVFALLGTTYAELSPSGKGVRAFFRGQLGDRKSNKGFPFAMETFSTKGFVTFTGNVLPVCQMLGNEDAVAPVDGPVLALFSQRFSRDIERETSAPTSNHNKLGLSEHDLRRALGALPNDLDYDQWIQVGMGLHHETDGEGFELWDEWSQRSSKYTTREYGWDRWRSFDRGNGPIVTARSLVQLANKSGAGINLNAPASADEFEALVAETKNEAPDTPPRFVFEPVHSFSSTEALPWIIKGVIPKAALGVVYGASGSGKSFVVLDMGMAVAGGFEWRGRKVRQGKVAYIAAEGADGFRKRLAAYAQHNKVDLSTIPMTVLNAAPNLLDKQDAADVAKGIKAAGGADLIIIDTFAQTTPGANENAGEDVGKALGYCKRIHENTGAMVLLIHHSGKDATKGARGWSGLRAACDSEIEVARTELGRSLRLTKSKDGEDGLEWGFDLDVVQLGVDEDMDPITSCVVVEAAIPVGGIASKKLGRNQRVVYDVIMEIAKSQTAGIEVDAVVKEAARRIMELKGMESDPKGNTRGAARSALRDLLNDEGTPFFMDDEDGSTLGVC